VLEALKSVDKVVVFNSDEELAQCIQDNDIDIMVVGSDWKGKKVIGEQYAKELKFFGRLGAYSTTSILERAK
jgi:bifunctional ADP-heptose synthase (sugar kinase/adenylyltransferase)